MGLNEGMGLIGRCCCLAFLCLSASAQVLSNGSLTGKYFVRHVQFTTDSTNKVTDARSIIGVITFDGAGHYSLTSQQTILTGPAAAYTASGTYAVTAAGIVTLTNPQTTTVNVNARFGTEAVIGSSTEMSGNTFDLFVAIPAPALPQTSASAQQGWSAADFELTGTTTAQVRSSVVSLSFDGAGNIGSLTLNGHAASVNSGVTVNQAVTGGTYSVTGDGSGTIAFPLPSGVATAGAMLSAAQRTLYISKSGNFILAGTPGAHDMFIATRNAAAGVTLTSGQRFWSAGMRVDSSGTSDSYAGSATVIAADSSFISAHRLHETGAAPFNVTAAALYTLAADGTGSVGPAKVAIESGGNMIAANNGPQLDPTGYEIGIGVTIPVVSGTGVFVNPQGIVNAASNAPAGDAISPGEFIAIYGSGLAASTVSAQALPFPTSLGGVTVSINGTLAPIYFAAAGQIDCIVPYEATGQTATITITNNGVTSNAVTVILAPTSPGVFSADGSGTGDGSITHADGSLVNAASPAKKGETVEMYVSGLGNLTTHVSDGSGATGVNNALTPLAVYVAGIPLPAASVSYQGLTVDAGLYQVNFVIPSTLAVSGEVPVALLTPDAFTDEVNMAVQ
jgi:uncharacterized protein (TIGR03437 family)